jgi:phosphotransferase system HPr-like phosphotransfer protein
VSDRDERAQERVREFRILNQYGIHARPAAIKSVSKPTSHCHWRRVKKLREMVSVRASSVKVRVDEPT